MGIENLNGNLTNYTVRRGDNLTKIARQNGTTIGEIIRLNPEIKNPNLIKIGQNLVLTDNAQFVQREDFDQRKMNLGTITVNGKAIEGDFKSNFFANNLDRLAQAGDKVVIDIKAGKECRQDDKSAFSLFNKVLSKHMNLNNEIITTTDGKKRPESTQEAFKKTEIYQYLISEDVNGDNFDENGNLIPRENETGNNVQLPTVGKDSNGKAYFVLHGNNDELLYFNASGKKVEFQNGVIVTEDAPNEQKLAPVVEQIQEFALAAPKESNDEFQIPQKYADNQLNMGRIFVDGKPVEISTDANFFRNNSNKNNIAALSLNHTGATRIDVQLQAGKNLNPKYNDDSADEILSSILGNNCDKLAIFQEQIKPKSLELLRETDLYQAFVSEAVNGQNFVNGKLKTPECGFNTVQLPSLEVDKNGTRYYVLHADEQVFYFDDIGRCID